MEAVYITAIQLDIPMNLVLQLKMCVNEMYSGVRVGKNLSDMFHIRNGLKQGDAMSHASQLCFRVHHYTHTHTQNVILCSKLYFVLLKL